MTDFKLCEKRNAILGSTGHLLVEGGPGSGKTTIALLKSKNDIDKEMLRPYQKILFLSFARATITRVEEQAKNIVSKADKKNIEINTYHGFAWSIIQSYGYLINKRRTFSLITPPNLSARISNIPDEDKLAFKKALFTNEGIVCFDLFASIASEILTKSNKICSIVSSAYPIIIVDEFQDTDQEEWNLIKLLGKKSRIIALADLNQRIYEFRGASVTRIPEFNVHFQPVRVDFGIENNRSSNTDIVQFGDDLLLGNNVGKQYRNVIINRYQYYADPRLSFKLAVLSSIERLKDSHGSNNWSIAILVNSKADTLSVSSYLTKSKITHEVLIDPAGPSLAASVIAGLLEFSSSEDVEIKLLIQHIVNHIRGRKGDKLSKADGELSAALENYLQTGTLRGPKRKSLLTEIEQIVGKRKAMLLTGVPEQDWLAVRKMFQDAQHEVLKNVFGDAQYLRLLNKGAILSEKLSDMWRLGKAYTWASRAVEEALTQEHFSMTNRSWTGIFVMNIHKSKGKEFDEVIILEELYKPIVPEDASPSRIQQARLVLRVAATRARSRTTFLTPESKPSILL